MEKEVIAKVRINKNLYGGQKLVTIPKESQIVPGDYVKIIKVKNINGGINEKKNTLE